MTAYAFSSTVSWWSRPIRCLLGLHAWMPHPSDRVRGRYCPLCGAEQWTERGTA